MESLSIIVNHERMNGTANRAEKLSVLVTGKAVAMHWTCTKQCHWQGLRIALCIAGP